MRAAFAEATFVHHQDQVGVADGREAVGDDERGATFEQFFQGLLDRVLGLGIDAAGGFVEHEHFGVVDEHADERQELPLPMRERRTPLTHVLLIPVGQPLDEPVGPDEGGGLFDLLQRHVRVVERQVALDRAGEEEHVLQHEPDVPPEMAQRKIADVDAIDQDLAFLDVVETQQQADDGRLPPARSADDGRALARLDGERDVAQVKGAAAR